LNVPADYPTIQDAVDASVDGDTVIVAPGTYKEQVLIDGKDITVRSSGGASVTTIDGGQGGTVVTINAVGLETPVFRGFTVTNGYAFPGPGGIAVNDGPAMVENNIVTGNLGCFGAGIGTGASSATIRHNTVTNNGFNCSGGQGAGVFIGGAGTTRLIGNSITANNGTAIELNAAGTPVIDANVVANNAGSAMSLGNVSDATVSNNLFRNNAGGVYALVPSGATGPTIVNNTFIEGGAGTTSPAITSIGFDSGTRIVNNIVIASSSQPAIDCPADYEASPPVVSHNDVVNSSGPGFGNTCAGEAGIHGNLSVDPKFIDPAAANFHLRGDSPLIDKGTNSGAPAFDIDGDPRPFDSNWDGTATVDPGFDEMTDPILVDPLTLAFGDVALGSASVTRIATVRNLGSVAVTISGAVVSRAKGRDFSFASNTCSGAPVAAHGSCTVGVRFAPKALGARASALTLKGAAPVGTRTVTLSGNGIKPPSGVAWGTTSYAGPAFTWNYGDSLGRTVQSGAQRLHLAYATDRIGNKWASDTGPYAGIYYVGSGSGATWTTPIRLNASNQHATVSGLAASGARVYVTWESQTKLEHYSDTAPRILYVRVNTSHGASTAWKTAIRLSSTTGRASFPTIAAGGTDVFIAWTNGDTGEIKLSISHDSGTTWKTITVGATTLNFADGYSGDPFVAVSETTVAITWLKDSSGGVAVRVSTDSGVSWDTTTSVGSGASGPGSVAVRDTRIAVAWPTADDLVVRQQLSGVWVAPLIVTHLATGASSYPYAPAVVLQDPDRIGVAWAEQRTTANDVDLQWAESADGGSLWFQTLTLASANASASRRANDWPSVLWPVASTRDVVWNGWTVNTDNYRQYFRSGSGSPVEPALRSVSQLSKAGLTASSDAGGSMISAPERHAPTRGRVAP